MSKPVVLVTGYPKFSNFTENISEKIIKILNEKNFPNFKLVTSLLSVDEKGSNSIANRIINNEKFDAIIHLGFSANRDFISLEKFAYNQYGMNSDDNSGRKIVSGPIIKGDLERYQTTAPILAFDELFNNDDDVNWSINPGRFVCNETYFRTLSALYRSNLQHKNIPVLFIHLPSESDLSSTTQLGVVEKILNCLFMKPKLKVVGALIFDIQGRILSCKRPKDDTWGGWWEFPGGKIEEGENPYQALTREIFEELNIEVSPLRIEEILIHEYDDKKVELMILNCGVIHPNKITLVEHDEMRWLSQEDLLEVKWLPADLPLLKKWSIQGLPSLHLD